MNEMQIEAIGITSNNAHVLLLTHAERQAFLALDITHDEALAIQLALDGKSPQCPTMHKVFSQTLVCLGARLSQIEISEQASHYQVALGIESSFDLENLRSVSASL